MDVASINSGLSKVWQLDSNLLLTEKYMKSLVKFVLGYLRRKVSFVKRYVLFVLDYKKFRKLSLIDYRFDVRWENRYPCLYDNTGTTGYDRHYVLHTAWAARILAEAKPSVHVDISSSLYFCAIASAFVSIKFYDYRPAELGLNNLVSGSCDLLSLPFPDCSIESLSCMHVIEHVGLGRYGERMNSNGDMDAIAELKRVLAANGMLLFVVPVGQPTVMYNAHRIYSYEQVMSFFKGFELMELALIPDSEEDGTLIRNADPDAIKSQKYACGCFLFRKQAVPDGKAAYVG